MIDLAREPMPDRLIFSPDEVQTLLSISSATFYREVAAGRLAAFKVGRMTKVERAELKRWIDQKKADSGLTGQDVGAS